MYKSLFIFTCLLLIPLTQVDALAITPTKIELSAQPGQVITDEVKLLNDTTSEVTLTWETQSFKANEDEFGQPEFYAPQDNELANWISVDQPQIILTPGQQLTVPFTINIPVDVSPGGHYAGLFWVMRSSADDQAGGVGVVGKTGHLILLKVDGDIIESGRLDDFEVKNKQLVFNALPIEFMTRFTNTGTVHVRPTGQIEIKNMMGKQVSLVALNTASGSVLPNSTRQFTSEWMNTEPVQGGFTENLRNEWQNFGLGRYQADLALVYGDQAQTEVAKAYFWVFPWRIILLSLITLVVVIGLLKLYNKLIIKRALKNS